MQVKIYTSFENEVQLEKEVNQFTGGMRMAARSAATKMHDHIADKDLRKQIINDATEAILSAAIVDIKFSTSAYHNDSIERSTVVYSAMICYKPII
jgi:hypothetical protein